MDNKKFIENLLLERDKKISELEMKIASKDIKIAELEKENKYLQEGIDSVTSAYFDR